MLSLIIMGMAFNAGNLDIIIVSGVVFFISGIILCNRLFRSLDGAERGIFDDYGYL